MTSRELLQPLSSSRKCIQRIGIKDRGNCLQSSEELSKPLFTRFTEAGPHHDGVDVAKCVEEER